MDNRLFIKKIIKMTKQERLIEILIRYHLSKKMSERAVMTQ